MSVLNATNGNLLRTLQLVFPRSKFSTRHICKLTGMFYINKRTRKKLGRKPKKERNNEKNIFICILISLSPFLIGKHWHDKENRRNCLIEVAQRMGFDPNDFSNWYNLSTSDVKRVSPLLISPTSFSFFFFLFSFDFLFFFLS